MDVSNAVDCNGLSVAPTVLRIKQALVGCAEKALPLDVLVDADCNHDRLRRSLGKEVACVRLLTCPQ